MKEFYRHYTETYHNGVRVYRSAFTGTICEESENVKEEEIFPITWENLLTWEKVPALGFSTFHFKKGRIVSFFEGSLFNKNLRNVKEWKNSLNIELHVYKEYYKPTLEEIFKRLPYDEAVEFLNSHNMEIRVDK